MTEKQKIIQDNTNYFYWTEGNKEKPPLVILPGFTGVHSDLTRFAREFKDDFFILIPDFPGWGESPAGNSGLTISSYAQFLHAVIKHEALPKVNIIGHCMGSVVGLEYAYLYPESAGSLFVVSVPYLHGTSSESYFKFLAHEVVKAPKILRPLFFFFRSRLFAVPLGFFVIQTKSLRKKLHIIWANTIKQQFQNEKVVERNWVSLVTFNYNKLKQLSLPIHILHGEKDVLISSQQAYRLAKLFKKATVDVIPRSGHMPPVETPETLATTLKKYLLD